MDTSNLFHQRSRLLLTSLFLLFVSAIVIRLYDIKAPGVLIEREYRSAINARVFYFAATDSIPEWRKKIAVITKERNGYLEPPITEFLVSYIYRIVNGEYLWLSHIVTSVFWLIGGVFFFKIAAKLASPEAALFSLAYYLFAPMGVDLSRSFQPDSLMIMMFLFSLFTILQYYDQPSMRGVLTAACVSGVALLVKPLCLFTIFGAFVSLAVYRRDLKDRVMSKRFVIFVAVTLLPIAVYYLYNIFIGSLLQTQAERSFRPNLLLHVQFWRDWLLSGTQQVGYTPLLVGLLGIIILQNSFVSALIKGLWIGFFIFGLCFSFHISTHGYYHAQLIPVIGLSFGPAIALAVNYLIPRVRQWHHWIAVASVVALVILFTLNDVWERNKSGSFENQALAQEIGEIVHHSSKTVYLARHYGRPLEYYGELSGVYWPRKITYWLYRMPGETERTIGERFREIGFLPEYFIITDFKEFQAHHSDLGKFLMENCPLVAQSHAYLIYGTCKGFAIAEMTSKLDFTEPRLL
jgi:hypothetical protein